MKKILLIAFGVFSLLSSFMTVAQTFTTAADTVWFTLPMGGSTVHNDISVTNQPINIKWNVYNTNMPQSWRDVVGICDQNFCRTNDAQNSLFTSSFTTVGTPYTDTTKLFDMQLPASLDTTAPGSYFVTINLKDVTNAGGTSKQITFMLNKFPTAVNKVVKGSDDITLYPNPARNELNVLFSADADIRIISVYNLIGKAVSVYKLSSNSSAKLNLENMPTGVYFIRLINGQGQTVGTRKFTHQ